MCGGKGSGDVGRGEKVGSSPMAVSVGEAHGYPGECKSVGGVGKPLAAAAKNGDLGYCDVIPGMGSRGGGTGKWEKFIPAELGVREAIEEGVRMVGPKKWLWRLVV